MKVLVIGNNTRSIVCSARRAGYTVYALDNFCDVDMRICADKAHFLGNVPKIRLSELAGSFGDVDAVILGPGYENLEFKNILNNRLSVIEEVNDKLKIAEKFSSMDIPYPYTESLKKPARYKFPIIIKPRSGSGGILNVMIKNEDELADFKTRNDASDFIAQEFVEGTPCSVSLIGTGDDAAVIALNEQLIGIPWLTRLPFAYCGNITPFHTKFSKDMIEYAKQIALELELVGSNGVDFILTKKGVMVLEVNPRFQGSLDTVELSTGINIFDAHVKSFSCELPKSREYKCFAGKAIVYSDKKVIINKGLSNRLIKCMRMDRAADIPEAGCVVKPDEPITTLVEKGGTRDVVLEKLTRYAHNIKSEV